MKQPVKITFDVDPKHAPALRSAVQELNDILAKRVESPHRFAKEAALTDALVAVGNLRAAINAVTPTGDPHYV